MAEDRVGFCWNCGHDTFKDELCCRRCYKPVLTAGPVPPVATVEDVEEVEDVREIEEDGRAEITNRTKQCPFCKSAIPANASTCARCGKEVGVLHRIGKGMEGCGCAMTLFITIPVILLFLFSRGC